MSAIAAGAAALYVPTSAARKEEHMRNSPNAGGVQGAPGEGAPFLPKAARLLKGDSSAELKALHDSLSPAWGEKRGVVLRILKKASEGANGDGLNQLVGAMGKRRRQVPRSKGGKHGTIHSHRC